MRAASNSGIQLMINELRDLVTLCDPPLVQHLTSEGIRLFSLAHMCIH